MPDELATLREQVAALNARIRVLESENDLLAERSEDMLLLGLVAEDLSAAATPSALLDGGLERISLLKSVPVCACYALDDGGPPRPLAVQTTLVSHPVDADSVGFPWPEELLRSADSAYLSDADLEAVSVQLGPVTFRPSALLAVTARRAESPDLLFVCADDSGDDHLATQSLLLHRLVDMIVSRMDALELTNSLHALNTELSAANASLRQATQAKTDFLSLISHEIRTPMNAILGFAQLLKRDPDLSESQRERLDIIDRNGEYLLALINDVLEMSKIEAGRSTVNESSFDLVGMLDDLNAIFATRAAADDVTLTVNVPACVPRYLSTDKAKLRQILVNLLSNAVKFTRHGSIRLDVSCEDLPGDAIRLCFDLEDTGVGVDDAEMALLFEPFAQTASGRASGSGTGLGLSISRQYARLLGGDLTASSTPGSGSTFKLTVIASVAAGSEPHAAEPPPAPRAPSRARHVLVADDFAEMRDLLAEMLTRLGYEVETVPDGAAALQRFRESRPDLLLVDMRMPGMDGAEVIRAIRAGDIAPDTPVVALTASAFSETRDLLLDAGASGFLSKPCTERELATTLAGLLAERGAGSEQADTTDGGEAQMQPGPDAVVDTTPRAPLPGRIVDAVRTAAAIGDFDSVSQLADEIGELDAGLADRLRACAELFDAQGVLDVISPN